MNKYIITVAVAVLGLGVAAGAQTPPPPPVPAAEAPANPGASPRPGVRAGAPDRPLETVTKYSGTLVKMVANDDYVYDGFYLLANGDSLLVKFPAHLGTRIAAVAKQGASITVAGVARPAPTGQNEVSLVSLSAEGKTIQDEGAPVAERVDDSYIDGSGTVTAIQTNREGITNGLLVDKTTIIRIPPHVGAQLSALIKKDAKVSYTGMKKAARAGEELAGKYTVVHARTLTVNGQQFLL